MQSKKNPKTTAMLVLKVMVRPGTIRGVIGREHYIGEFESNDKLETWLRENRDVLDQFLAEAEEMAGL